MRGATLNDLRGPPTDRAGTVIFVEAQKVVGLDDTRLLGELNELPIVAIICGKRPEPFRMWLIGRAKKAGTARARRADLRDASDGAEKRDCGSESCNDKFSHQNGTENV